MSCCWWLPFCSLAVLAVAKDPDAAASRVIQGVITGVGFHGPTGMQVQGLTTAATIWITASLGVLCGLALWKILSIAFVLTFLLLIPGVPVEKWLTKGRDAADQSDRTGST
jgi:putative Mg2+ transporter-C (MgtC) family protein